MKNYKSIEKERFDAFSKKKLEDFEKTSKVFYGSKAVDIIYREPYIYYENLIKKYSNEGSHILDICCGDGIHSFSGCEKGAKLTLSDIAPKSIELALKKSEKLGFKIDTIISDADNLDFPKKSFDIISIAGSLSYVDQKYFFKKISAFLTDRGKFICVDSFGINPIYNFNRFLHFLKGERTLHVNKRIPNYNTIKILRKEFNNVEIKYFGIFIFLSPLFKLFLTKEKCAKLIKFLDQKLSFLNFLSFKIVILAMNENEGSIL